MAITTIVRVLVAERMIVSVTKEVTIIIITVIIDMLKHANFQCYGEIY